MALAPAHVVEKKVTRDLKEIRRKRRMRPVAMPVLIETNEGFLGQITCHDLVMAHVPEEGDQAILPAMNDFVESGIFTAR